MDISQPQWLSRKFTLHHYTKGYQRQQMKREIIREVEHLANVKSLDVPKKNHYQLEIPLWLSKSSLSVHDAYWVLAMKAAKISC
jgi:hypothetical protein